MLALITQSQTPVIVTGSNENRLHVHTIDGRDLLWSECSEGWYPQPWASIEAAACKIVQPTARILELAREYDAAVEKADKAFGRWGAFALHAPEFVEAGQEYDTACVERGAAYWNLAQEIIDTAQDPDAGKRDDLIERDMCGQEVR